MDNDKVFLDKFMDLYVHSPYLYIWRAAEAAAIAKLINKNHLNGNHILDIGCGDGIFSSVLFEKIFAGSDLSFRSLIKAGASGVYLNNLQADAVSLPFKDESFKMCFSNCVFEHIYNDNKAFSEANRVLQKDGYFIFTVPSDDFESMLPGYFLRKLFPVFWKMLTARLDRSLVHYHYYNLRSLEDKLRETGLQVIDCQPYVTPKQFKIWIVSRTVESAFKRLKMQRVNLLLAKIFRRLFKSRSAPMSVDFGKHGGLAILCRKI
jgi:ubiquinone/menaquinone biosynthesis C-methylase UbiE